MQISISRRRAKLNIPPVPLLLDGLSAAPTMAYSIGRQLATSFTGTPIGTTGSNIDDIFDQSGNGVDTDPRTGAVPGTLTPSGPNLVNSILFDQPSTGGSAETYTSISTNTLFPGTGFYCVFSIRPQDVAAVASLGNGPHVLSAAFVDRPVVTIGSNTLFVGCKFGSLISNDYPVSNGVDYIVEFWWAGSGDFFSRVNGTNELSVTPSAALSGGNTLHIAGVNSGSNLHANIYEMIAFDGVPTLIERDAIVADMKTYLGI